MIEVDNLVKKYGSHVAVDHLSFTVEKGEVIGFLGPNGAGKSTTMNIITGYIPATEGGVKVNGHDINENPKEVKRSIGYLPEIPPLYPDMKVKEYLKFVADIKKVEKAKQAKMMEDIMSLTGIKDMEQRLIKNLSKGYKQRVGLAGAIMGYPEVIILDEPTVGLDPVQIIEIRDLIKDLAKTHTVILSSHILSEVSAVCDKVMIINKGKLIVSDTPDNLVERMQNQRGIHLTIKGEREVVEKAFSEIEGIKDIKWEEEPEESEMHSLTIYTKETEDLRENIFYKLAKYQCPIMELSMMTMSLEDIFLEVTKEKIELTPEECSLEKEEE